MTAPQEHPSTHDSHENPFTAGAAQARAFGYEQIARAFDALEGQYVPPAEEERPAE